MLTPAKKEENVSLEGAVQISHSSFFVYKNNICTFLKSGNDEKLHKCAVKRMIASNPFVKKILKRYKIKPSINTKTLRELAGGHMNDTCNIAIGVYNFLPEELKSQVDMEILKEASMLHDLGKILIPAKILNKPAKLNIKERKIMNVHSILGYELLKTQNISPETLALIKYHHQNLKHSGYPSLTKDDLALDVGLQIISIADKYSALREARVYRKRLSRLNSLLILYREVREGKIMQEIFDALLEYAKVYDC